MRDVERVIVIGGGIVGLATAFRLLELRPGLQLTVLEKEPLVGRHQTGHNSGVVHRGLYYQPGTLKAELCVQGAAQLEAFCAEHDIRLDPIGKLVIAADEGEMPRLDELHRRGVANRTPGLVLIEGDRIADIEPHATGFAALHSPRTSIVDFGEVTEALRREVESRGGRVVLREPVTGITESSSEVTVTAGGGRYAADRLVTCAGLQSDRMCRLGGVAPPNGVRIVPFRGDYFLLDPDRRGLCRGLIYPVPDPAFPFLGVHFTPRTDGSVWLGPNAVLAMSREGYRPAQVSGRDLIALAAFPGFWRMGLRYWRTGLGEMWRAARREKFLAALRRFVPELAPEDLLPGPSGVRAQAVASDGSLVDDFVFGSSDRQLHVLNAPSPAATSSLAIGSLLADRVIERT